MIHDYHQIWAFISINITDNFSSNSLSLVFVFFFFFFFFSWLTDRGSVCMCVYGGEPNCFSEQSYADAQLIGQWCSMNVMKRLKMMAVVRAPAPRIASPLLSPHRACAAQSMCLYKFSLISLRLPRRLLLSDLALNMYRITYQQLKLNQLSLRLIII